MARLLAYRPEIDGLRAISIVSILIHHFNSKLLPGGFLGVDIFFVLSGFVISGSLFNVPEQGWREYLLNFYSRRIKRITPALIISVVVCGMLECMFINPNELGLTASSRTGQASLLGLSNFYLLRIATDYFSAPADFNLFTHTWSLGVEEQFYLVFPMILGLTGFSRKKSVNGIFNLLLAMLPLCALSLALYFYLARTNSSAGFYMMFSRFWELGVGCITFCLSQGIGANLKRQLKAPILYVSFLTLATSLFIGNKLHAFAAVAVCLTTSIIILSRQSDSFFAKVLRSSIMVRLGLLSYSLYLWHWPILALARWTVGISWQTAAFLLLLIFGMAFGSYHYIEKPLRHAEWSKSKGMTIGYGIAAVVVSVLFIWTFTAFLGKKVYLGSIVENEIHKSHLFEDPESCRYDLTGANMPLLVSCGFADTRSNTDAIAPKIYLLGDSHAETLLPLIEGYTESEKIHLAFSFGRSCPFPPISTSSDLTCLSGATSVLGSILLMARPGDLVIISNAFEGYGLTEKSIGYDHKVAHAEKQIDGFAKQLAVRHVRLLIFGVKPRFSEIPSGYFCIEEWFKLNSHLAEKCILNRQSEIQDREILLNAFNRLEYQNENLKIVNLFDYACSETECRVYDIQKKSLTYIDSNHLSLRFFTDRRVDFNPILNFSLQLK